MATSESMGRFIDEWSDRVLEDMRAADARFEAMVDRLSELPPGSTFTFEIVKTDG